ncbi:MAG TPA: crosslink repair DNA glycosylase YcaQ family protein [Rectinemataceae bacterium]|nr:crosslink repair DNA glycosylase YcaQ family protein [Rectinemataceae bacterium]
MKEPVPISLEEAKRLAIAASGLSPAMPTGSDDSTLAVLSRLGSVQIDSINVVARAHHHIIWARNPKHDLGDLARLEAEPRRVFEYWSHAAAYLPMTDWRYCLPRMEKVRAKGHPWFGTDPLVVEEVRARLRAEGPLGSGHWVDEREEKAGWWDWKPAKIALEYLFHSGEIMSVTRSGFKKIYDLTERALPAWVDTRMPNEEEMAAWYVDRAIASLGVFARRDVAYGRKEGLSGIDAEISRRLETGELVSLRLEASSPPGPSPEPSPSPLLHYARPGDVDIATAAPGTDSWRAFILSPFDPLVIDRRRLGRLFGLEYQIECYVPEKKRSFGYFALPILALGPGGEAAFAGLLDAKLERKESLLRVKRLALWRERPRRGSGKEGAADRGAFASAIVRALAAYALWQGATSIVIERLDAEDPVLARLVASRASRASLISRV